MFAHHEHLYAELHPHPYIVRGSRFLFEDKSPELHMLVLFLGTLEPVP